MRTTTLVWPLLTIAACGGGGGGTDIQSTLVFADRSDLEIARLINATAGTDMFTAQAMIDQFGDTFDGDPCPAVSVAGNVATVTGGCTRRDGQVVQGGAVVTNPIGWDQIEDYIFDEDTVYEANALVLIDSGFTQSFDGVIRQTGQLTTWDADITVSSFDLTVRSDLYYRCSDPSNPSCSLTGSGIELVGVGGAQVSGHVEIDRATNRQTSDFTLQGVDRVVVHSDGTCVEWSIEGTGRGMPCP